MATKETKAKIIDSLQETFAQSKVGVFTDYRGLTTPQIVALRRKLKESGGSYKVVKNTLARFGAEKAGKGAIKPAFEGPMAVAYSSGDEVSLARALAEHIAATKLALKITGGFLGNRLLTAKEVATLASLPSREILLGKVMGGIQSPLYAFMGQLTAPLRGFMNIMQSRIKQLEEK